MYLPWIYELKNHCSQGSWKRREIQTGINRSGTDPIQQPESLEHPSCWTDSHSLCSQCCNKVSQVPWDHPGHPTRLTLKILWAQSSHGIPLARLRAVFYPSCTQKTSCSKTIIKMTMGFCYKQHDLYKSVHKVQISNVWFPVTCRYCWNNSSSGKQMPERDIWRMLNGGKAGRSFSLKSKEYAPKNVTEETFLLRGIKPLINLSPWVKYVCFQRREWNRGAHTASFFSSAGRTIRSIFFYWLQKHYPKVWFIRNLQEA